MHNFKELIVWQKARILVKDIYVLVASFPDNEKFGINSQIKRSAISIASNMLKEPEEVQIKILLDFLILQMVPHSNLKLICIYLLI